MNKNTILTVMKRLVLSVILLWTINGCEKTPSQQTVSEFKQVLESLMDYKYGDSRSWLQQYHNALAKIHNDTTIQSEAEKLMIQVLESEASLPSKLLICRSISPLASSKSLAILQKMLEDQETSHMAIIALQPMPFVQVDEILIKALSKLQGHSLIGVMNALAIRKPEQAVSALEAFIEEPDPAVAHAAIFALGKIGNGESIQILFAQFQKSPQDELAEALIDALQSGSAKQTHEIYQNIYDANPSLSIKTAAFEGLLLQQADEQKITYLMDALQSSDLEFQESMIQVIRKLPADISLHPLVQVLPSFKPPFQQQLMLALADRGEEHVRPFAIAQLSSAKADVRMAGLKALKSIALPKDILMLARIAGTSQGAEQELARACLYWMKSEETDRAIAEAVKSASPNVRSELIKAIGYRKIDEALEYTIAQISISDPKVRLAAIETAGMIGTRDDLNEVKNRALTWVISEAEAEVIVEALTRISLNSGDPDWCADEINASFATFSNESPMIILISTLGNIGTNASLSYIRPFLSYDDYDIQFAALKALSTWQNDAPLPDLEEYLQAGEYTKNRQMAQVGVVNLVQNSGSMTGDEKARKLKAAFQSAQSTAERVIVLNGISRIYALQAMDFVISQLNNEELSSVAQEAFIRIADNLKYSYEAIVIQKIDSIAGNEIDEEFKTKLKLLKRSIEL